MIRWVVMAALLTLAARPAAGLTPDRVLILWNSQNAESQAVRDAYVAARPGVLELDLNNPNLGPGELTRNQWRQRVRDPLLSYLSGSAVDGTPLAERVIAIVTTRGLPARVAGAGEFTFASQRASLESEITLVHQNLSGAGAGSLPFRYSGIVDNPYHMTIGREITTFDRSSIRNARPFTLVDLGEGNAVWTASGLTSGDIYLVTRLDAGPGDGTTALEETIALIQRSVDLGFSAGCVQALFDEFPASEEQFDDNGVPPVFPADEDFELASDYLRAIGVATTHDETANFVTAGELTLALPLIALGTYGENHDVGGAGENPPGQGTYLSAYEPHPAGAYTAYESFSGNCLVTGGQRQGQACGTDWIAAGGSFALVTVAEPLAFAVADLDPFVRNFYGREMTFAEAAYSAIPGLSWANTPIGDPLARVVLLPAGTPEDLSGDGFVDATDLAVLIGAWGTSSADLDGDGVVGAADLALLIGAWGPADPCP